MRLDRLDLTICVFLMVAILVVFSQMYSHDFISLDDGVYVTENPYVSSGFTGAGFVWAFKMFNSANWHPLTWLSHMLDCQLFGLKAGLHHLTSLLFHMANSILLFFVLRRMTGAIWRSGFVAALFALHPLHVESVAWISERKDVLSAFFWMLTMLAYVRYTERPGFNRYLLVLIFFTLGLMSKSMVVTLPFVLLLIDFWPLCRVRWGQLCEENRARFQESQALRLVWEKIPLFALAGMSCVLTVLSEQGGGATRSLDLYPIETRLANALISYASYIGKTFWPFDLAFYTYQRMIPIWKLSGAGLLLIGLSVMSVMAARRRPYVLVGWLWYVGALVPVIGLVQVGDQPMADRYTYIPLIGLFILIAWGTSDMVKRWRYGRTALGTTMGLAVLCLIVVSWLQVRHWKDSISIFTHTINAVADNYGAHNRLGVALEKSGRQEEAIGHYSEALRIAPRYGDAHNNLGRIMAAKGRLDAAIDHFRQALRARPGWALVHYNLGVAKASQGRFDEAVRHFSESLKRKPDYVEVYNNLGIVLAKQGKANEAIECFSKALSISPEDAMARRNLEQAIRVFGGRSGGSSDIPKSSKN